MDTTIAPIDTVNLDGVCPEIEDISFGKEITKTLILSAATTAGMIGGLVVVGLVANKVNDFRKQRHDKKVVEKAEKVDVSDKNPANKNH